MIILKKPLELLGRLSFLLNLGQVITTIPHVQRRNFHSSFYTINSSAATLCSLLRLVKQSAAVTSVSPAVAFLDPVSPLVIEKSFSLDPDADALDQSLPRRIFFVPHTLRSFRDFADSGIELWGSGQNLAKVCLARL